MENQSKVARNKAVVDAYYQAGKEGRLTDFASYLHPDFTTNALDYLPWGGTPSGAGFFRDTILPNLPDTLDFSRVSYDVLVGEGNQVVALINIGVAGTEATIKTSEHWTVEDGKARPIWVAYPEPQSLLDKLGIVHGFKTH
jgi:ketosteroid isomerase-like protein